MTDARAELKKLRPSAGFHERLERALIEAERNEQAERASHDSNQRRFQVLVTAILIVLPTLALVVQVSRGSSLFTPRHVAEQHVHLPADGAVLIDLTRSLERSAEVYSTVALKVPHAILVHGMPGASRMVPRPRCDDRHCVYELRDLTRAVGNLRLTINAPGTHQIGVERSEGSRRRRDVILLHAKH